jgi:hypothetical protein
MGRRFLEQLRATRDALGTPLASGPGPDANDHHYAYQRGTVLVPAHAVPHALVTLNGTPRGGSWARPEGEEVRAGLRRISVGDPGARGAGALSDDTYKEEDRDVLDALGLLNTPANDEYTAAPNHVVSIANVNMCPADEPSPPAPTAPLSLSPLPGPPAPDGPHVLIVDTGLVPEVVRPSPYVGGVPRTPPLTDPDGYIREYVGHGTFIAEIVAGVAPGARVWVSNLLPDLGAAFDDVFGMRLDQALDEFEQMNGCWPEIISLSAGSTVMSLDRPLAGHASFMSRLAEHPGTLLVAAAGNNGDDTPFWPAAAAETADNVISVGALREAGDDRACFSDFGPWVSVYAPGERIVAGFLRWPLKYQHSTFGVCQFLRYSPPDCTCQNPPHVGELTSPGHGDVVQFAGRAQWSGTSFATPMVAGMIAQGLVHDGGAGVRAAAEAVLKNATQVIVEETSALAVFPDNYTGRRPTA